MEYFVTRSSCRFQTNISAGIRELSEYLSPLSRHPEFSIYAMQGGDFDLCPTSSANSLFCFSVVLRKIVAVRGFITV